MIHKSSEVPQLKQKCVARANPKIAVTESIQFKSEDRLELRIGISEEWEWTLRKLKDLIAQSSSKPIDSEAALLIAMNEYIERDDPVLKAQ